MNNNNSNSTKEEEEEEEKSKERTEERISIITFQGRGVARTPWSDGQ